MSTAKPLVSVITPTWRRGDLLMERCYPSVYGQTYLGVEHVIVSDGPDPGLRERFNALAKKPPVPLVAERVRPLWFLELAEHSPERHWGHLARLYGLTIAEGELITYCDDDDALRAEHCALLAQALIDDPGAGFAVSRMMTRGPTYGQAVIGWGPLGCGNIGSPMIMHRREILEHGTWGPASSSEDWDMVERWLKAGIRCADVPEVTADVWPSVFRGT
jgi:Glycosyl transferase family 2